MPIHLQKIENLVPIRDALRHELSVAKSVHCSVDRVGWGVFFRVFFSRHSWRSTYMPGRCAVLLVMTLSPLACAWASPDLDCPPQEEEVAALKILLEKDPEALAKSEAQKERPQFIAVRGYGATFPGLGDDPVYWQCVLSSASSMPMPGTSDVLCTDEIVRLQPAANQFAKRYNEVLLGAMDLKCP
ncbi:hypothetical protein [Pseudomonas sp. 3A(2025)]